MDRKVINRIFIALAVSIATFSLSFFLNLLTVLVFTCLLSIYIKRHLNTDYVISFIFSVLIASIATGIVLNVVAITGGQYFFGLVSFVFSAGNGLLLFTILNKRSSSTPASKITISTWISIGIAILAFIFFTLQILIHRDTASLISFFSQGEDNISHFTIFNYILQNGRPAIGQSEGIWSGLANYPQGVHAFFAYLTSSINQFVSFSPNQLLRIYYIIVSLLASTLAFLTVKTILISIKRYSFSNSLLSISVFLLLFICLIVPFTKLGYFTQMSAAIYTSSFLLFALSRLSSAPSKQTFVVLSISIAGVLTSWYLAAILFIPLYAYVAFKFKQNYIAIFSAFSMLTLAALSGIYHIVYGDSTTALQDSMGDPFGFSAVSLVAPILLAALLLTAYKMATITYLQFCIAASFVLILYLFGFSEIIIGGELNYFFYKLAMIVTYVTILLLTAATFKSSKLYQLVLSVTVLFLLIYILIAQNYANHIKSFLIFTPNTYFSLQTINEITPEIDSNAINTKKNLVYVNDCSYFGQYMMNRWLGAIFLTQNNHRRLVEISGFKNNINSKDLDTLSKNSESALELHNSIYCLKRDGF